MKKCVLFVLSILFFMSCKDKNVETETKIKEKGETFSLPKSDYAILPFSENTHYIFKDVKTANLSEKELIEIEALFQKMVTEHNAGQARVLAKHNKENPDNQWKETGYELEKKSFKRQYLPVINEKGEKEVWINFFCAEHLEGNRWKTKRHRVLDGGNCYYNLKINLVTKEIYALMINGYA